MSWGWQYAKLKLKVLRSYQFSQSAGVAPERFVPIVPKTSDKPQKEAYPPVSPSSEISGPSPSLTRTLSFSPSNVRVHRWASPSPRISLSIRKV